MILGITTENADGRKVWQPLRWVRMTFAVAFSVFLIFTMWKQSQPIARWFGVTIMSAMCGMLTWVTWTFGHPSQPGGSYHACNVR